MEYVKPEELYDTECFLVRGGNMNKLDELYVEGLISLGRDGLSRRILETYESMKWQWCDGRRIVNNGCHRAYAAFKLGLEAIPMKEEVWSTGVRERLVHISEWDLLSKEEHVQYLEMLELAEPIKT